MRKFDGYRRGINLGGWLSQCGQDYTEERYSTFITETDIERIAGWGLDHVRVPVDYNVIQSDDGSFIESGWKHIDDVVDWCGRHGLKLVIDLHKASGYFFGEKERAAFFESKPHQDMFVKLWQEMTRRYAKYSDRVSFELLNEVTERSMAEPWNRIITRTVAAIREISKDVRIIYGGIGYSSIGGLTLLEAPADENIVFTFHCYSPHIFTHQAAHWERNIPKDYRIEYPGDISVYRRDVAKYNYGSVEELELAGDCFSADFFEKLFAPALEVAEKFDVPLYCGEYGAIDNADPQSTLRWITDINVANERHGIPRALWNYKQLDFGLIGDHYAPVREQIIEHL